MWPVRALPELVGTYTLQSDRFHVTEDQIVGFPQQGLDLKYALLEVLQVINHHAQEVGLCLLIKSSCIDDIFLDDLMEEEEGVFVLGEASTVSNYTPVCLVGEANKFLLEGCPPRNAILLLLLDVFAGHVGGVVEQGHVPLHDGLAVLAGVHAVLTVDILFDEALRA